ncbi:GGDEF domain-containing protein [Methylobacterium symbioticum]|uniref:diguanylate cyclase n=1 Tax=Methylobacterium symbioticum TaxID=2584084 RepID=A0A509EB02_9HYPH|nr:diguanylate cyclase [Methylobacterium symbioticum]VUD71340.1 Phytochrome-like protein cph2 [Methylobacterium symbioticum]
MQSKIERSLRRPWHQLALPPVLEALYLRESTPTSGRIVQSWLAIFILFNILSLKTDFDAFGPERFHIPLIATLGVFVPVALGSILVLRGRPSHRRQTLAALVTAIVDMVIVLNSARLAPPEHVNTYLIFAALVPLVVGMIAPMPFRHSLWFCGSAFLLYVAGVFGLGFAGVEANGVPLLVASLTLVPIKLAYSREWEAKRSFLLGLREREQATELARANARLATLSETDPLTGVPNRRLFDRSLAEAWAQAGAQGDRLCVALFDIDHFKLLNDTAGHAEGDRCIRQIATVLTASVSASGGLLARYGGEEFAALLPGAALGSGTQIAEAARRAVADLAVPHPGLRPSALLTVSVGVAALQPGPAEAGPAALLKRADDALYAAKKLGRNRVEPHPAQAQAEALVEAEGGLGPLAA